jgi:serine/threonine-protein kinase RsbW
MGFRAAADVVATAPAQEAEQQVEPPPGETVVSVAAGALAPPVLGRVTAMLAARAGFSVDRLADAVLISDAIAAHAPASMLGRHIHVGIDTAASSLDLKVGPLDAGGGGRIVDASAVGGMPAVVDQLSDTVDVETAGGREELHVRLTDER